MDENFAMNTQSIDSQPEAGSRVRWPIRNQIMLPMVSLMVARLVAVSVLNAFLSVRRTHRRIARELNEVATTLVNPNFRGKPGTGETGDRQLSSAGETGDRQLSSAGETGDRQLSSG